MTNKEKFEKYHEAIFSAIQEDRDYKLTSEGYGSWYYDCLPENKQYRVLDVGCGDGKFLYYLEQCGYTNIEGLEISPQQAEEARKYIKCPIHLVDDTRVFLKESESNYNMIVLNDVLEHIPKDQTIGLLRDIRNALKMEGTIVVNSPGLATITSTYARYIDFTHEIIFTEVSLKQVLLMAGFCDISFIKQKWPLKLTPRHLAFRLARKIWHCLLRLIYIIESPAAFHPNNFQTRLVATAKK